MLKPNEGKRPHLLSNWTFQTGASGHHRWGQFTSTRCYWSELAKWLILHAAPRISEQASSPFYFVKFTAQQSKPAITASNIKKKKKHKSRPFSSCSEVTSFWPPLHGTFLCGEERWCGNCGGKPSSFCSSASHRPLHAQRCWQETVAPQAHPHLSATTAVAAGLSLLWHTAVVAMLPHALAQHWLQLHFPQDFSRSCTSCLRRESLLPHGKHPL